jgi:hypothetical protein
MPKLLLVIGYLLLAVGVVALIVTAKRWRKLDLWQTVVISGFVVTTVGGIARLTQLDWTDLSSWVGITQSNANQVQVLATIFAGLVALVGIFFIVRQLKITERGLRQAARANLDIARTEHNWKLLEYKVDPGLPGLPSWPENEEYWKWRIVHLDHLNLLHTQWIDYNSRAISQEEIRGWIGWARLFLEELQRDRDRAIEELRKKEGPITRPTARQIMEFEKTSPRLKALLHISELHNWDLFPPTFVTWLLDECRFSSLGLARKHE